LDWIQFGGKGRRISIQGILLRFLLLFKGFPILSWKARKVGGKFGRGKNFLGPLFGGIYF